MADYTILIIDYNPRSVESIRSPLERAGYRVEVAADGLEGIKAFETLEPDLTLVEAMLPKKHGFEVCQELKETPHGRRAPVFIVTGVYRGRKYRHQAMHQHGCDRYLEKPLSDNQLLEAVHAFLPAVAPLPVEPVAVEAVTASVPDDNLAGAIEPEPQVEASAPIEPDPDFAAAELEIMSQLDNLFSDDSSSSSAAEPSLDSNAKI